jgi:hypothetical protein
MDPIDIAYDGTRVAPDPQQAVEACSRLLQRIATLERIIQQEQVNGVRVPLLEPMLQRLKLLQRMLDRVGVDESRGMLVGLLIRESEANCMSCRNAAQCRRWLDSATDDDAHLGFCANAALFELFPHKVI